MLFPRALSSSVAGPEARSAVDVAIVGAGLVGSALAAALGECRRHCRRCPSRGRLPSPKPLPLRPLHPPHSRRQPAHRQPQHSPTRPAAAAGAARLRAAARPRPAHVLAHPRLGLAAAPPGRLALAGAGGRTGGRHAGAVWVVRMNGMHAADLAVRLSARLLKLAPPRLPSPCRAAITSHLSQVWDSAGDGFVRYDAASVGADAMGVSPPLPCVSRRLLSCRKLLPALPGALRLMPPSPAGTRPSRFTPRSGHVIENRLVVAALHQRLRGMPSAQLLMPAAVSGAELPPYSPVGQVRLLEACLVTQRLCSASGCSGRSTAADAELPCLPTAHFLPMCAARRRPAGQAAARRRAGPGGSPAGGRRRPRQPRARVGRGVRGRWRKGSRCSA